nr:protein kinase C-binding protein NELL1-like [Oncorhynchus nerka]
MKVFAAEEMVMWELGNYSEALSATLLTKLPTLSCSSRRLFVPLSPHGGFYLKCCAFCEEGCRSGGTCVSPNTCVCPSGFTGLHCETDIDECAEVLIQCHIHSRCVNLPGWYHCECRNGFHDNGSYLIDGSSCIG